MTNVILVPCLVVARVLCDLVYFIVITYCIVETLFAFDILTLKNRRAYMLKTFLAAFMNPILEPLRRKLPNFGLLDLSTLALLLVSLFFRIMISEFLKTL